jgi:hypothetical protein
MPLPSQRDVRERGFEGRCDRPTVWLLHFSGSNSQRSLMRLRRAVLSVVQGRGREVKEAKYLAVVT